LFFRNKRIRPFFKYDRFKNRKVSNSSEVYFKLASFASYNFDFNAVRAPLHLLPSSIDRRSISSVIRVKARTCGGSLFKKKKEYGKKPVNFFVNKGFFST